MEVAATSQVKGCHGSEGVLVENHGPELAIAVVGVVNKVVGFLTNSVVRNPNPRSANIKDSIKLHAEGGVEFSGLIKAFC